MNDLSELTEKLNEENEMMKQQIDKLVQKNTQLKYDKDNLCKTIENLKKLMNDDLNNKKTELFNMI